MVGAVGGEQRGLGDKLEIEIVKGSREACEPRFDPSAPHPTGHPTVPMQVVSPCLPALASAPARATISTAR